MNIFETLGKERHEQVVLRYDPETGYRGILAVHDTTLGPALAGTRLWPYGADAAALEDAVRLARSMTYRAAAAGLPLGGGAAVVVRPSGSLDREAVFRAHGRAIEGLGGRFITIGDVGTTREDLERIREETRHVLGVREDAGPLTGLGVLRGIQAAAAVLLGRDTLEGLTVAIEGLGSVGYGLARLLSAAGVRLLVADLDGMKVARAVGELAASPWAPGEIRTAQADVFAPCGVGGVIGVATAHRLRCRIVAGGATDQLVRPRDGDDLAARGIVYLPDYVINAGGLIGAGGELFGWPVEEVRRRTFAIYDTVVELLEESRRRMVPVHRVADARVEARLKGARKVRVLAAS